MNGASLMDEIGKITNPGKCKTVAGPCHRASMAWWSFGRSRLLCKPVRRGNTGRERAVWSHHRVSFLGRAGTEVCTEMRCRRLCSAEGRWEGCRAGSPGGCFPALHFAVGWGSTCSPADREAASLFPLIWTSCAARGERCCSSKPSFTPEANWSGSRGLSGFLPRFPPLFCGINNT